MTLEQAVKPITLSILAIGILIAVYVLWASKQDTESTNNNAKNLAQQSSTLSTDPLKPEIRLKPVSAALAKSKSAPDRSKDEGLPKFTDFDKEVTNIRDLRPDIKVSGGTEELNFEPEAEMDYSEIQVVISLPNGRHFRKTFASGEAVSLVNENLEDGTYAWETRASPKIEASVRKEMAEVRKSGNLEAQQKLVDELREDGYLPSAQQAEANTQSGYFTIKDGEIISGDESEQSFSKR
jgi:hypothetical protein